MTADNGVLVVRGLGAPGGVGGARARIVVRALALGYGLLATMAGDGLEDVLNTLHAREIGTEADERSRLGVVLTVVDDAGTSRVTAAHYVRPVALDTHGHVQRLPPAILCHLEPGDGPVGPLRVGRAARHRGPAGDHDDRARARAGPPGCGPLGRR